MVPRRVALRSAAQRAIPHRQPKSPVMVRGTWHANASLKSAKGNFPQSTQRMQESRHPSPRDASVVCLSVEEESFFMVTL